MATLVLQTAGAALGGAIGGPIGSALGQALGAAVGGAVDQRLFGGGGQNIEGPRLDSVRYLASGEGNPVPRLFGTSRIAGEIIWATRFQEVISKKKVGGGKGGPPKSTVTEYSYFANFAIGLCEGEIGGIGRIWADGTRIKQPDLTFRVYKGTEFQMPDSLIETKQGAGNAPAFRGSAYIVFENFPLESYGNRIPQISVEVVKPAGALEKTIKAVNMIPGASEFAYDVNPVEEQSGELSTMPLNVHQLEAETDFLSSLDMLQATCPNLEQVSLVVAWFGDDLRAGQCTVKPKVEVSARSLVSGEEWFAGGLRRVDAELVSRIQGRPALGGTPSDGSVIRAIQEIKARGLRVAITPFLMMDIPQNNGLPDPYGNGSQGAYPWRGRIIASSGPHTKSGANRTEVTAFVGTSSASGIDLTAGSADENTDWCYRRMILHYAKLGQAAGGVDQFLIGSEMRGLTSVRDQNNEFPFVEALVQLANDVRPMLGNSCIVSYAADWSEYFHYKPDDGSQDVFHNLDPLWANANIDAVAIDNYFPIGDHQPDGFDLEQGRSTNDPVSLREGIEGGEGYDWFYASQQDRENRNRTDITDGLGKPWTFRFKDIRNWIENQHFDRRNGIEVSNPSMWQPNSKPIMFAELGAPAVHNAMTRPNVFPDPKSSEDALPFFSNRGRDDQAQAAYLTAFQGYWDSDHPDYVSGTNPVLATSGRKLVDMSRCQMWAWDARPYPEFPLQKDVWSDGDNWVRGHWLNGRLGRLRIADLIAEILTDAGLENVDTRQVYGLVDGFVLAEHSTARSALEALINAFQITASEENGILVFRSPGWDPVVELTRDDLVFEKDVAATIRNRAQSDEIPTSVELSHLDRSKDYQVAKTSVKIGFDQSHNKQSINLPITTGAKELAPLMETWLESRATARDTIQFSLSRQKSELTIGDVVRFSDLHGNRLWQLTEINEGLALECSAVSVRPFAVLPAAASEVEPVAAFPISPQYIATFLDLPVLPFTDGLEANRIAVAAAPWRRPAVVYSSVDGDAFNYLQTVPAPASIGNLVNPLAPTSVISRWVRSDTIELQLFSGELSSANATNVFSGSNAIAIGSNEDGWEIIQFLNAQALGDGRWVLSDLLRGQAGTDDIAAKPKPDGTRVVVLDASVEALSGSNQQLQRDVIWSVGPLGDVLGSTAFVQQTFAPGIRHLIPLCPVHLRANKTANGDLALTWIRRERTGGDPWELLDVPMSEVSEAYTISISSDGQERQWSAFSPDISIANSELTEWLGVGTHDLTIAVAQISAAIGSGIPTEISTTILL